MCPDPDSTTALTRLDYGVMFTFLVVSLVFIQIHLISIYRAILRR